MGRCLDGMNLSQKTDLKEKSAAWPKRLTFFHKGEANEKKDTHSEQSGN